MVWNFNRRDNDRCTTKCYVLEVRSQLFSLFYHWFGWRSIPNAIPNMVRRNRKFINKMVKYYWKFQTKVSIWLAKPNWLLDCFHSAIHRVSVPRLLYYLLCNHRIRIVHVSNHNDQWHQKQLPSHQWMRKVKEKSIKFIEPIPRNTSISFDHEGVKRLQYCILWSGFTFVQSLSCRLAGDLSDLIQPIFAVIISSAVVTICGALLIIQKEMVQIIWIEIYYFILWKQCWWFYSFLFFTSIGF